MSDIATIFGHALLAFNNLDVETAENGFRQVIKRDPSHVPALNLLTVALMSTGRFADAEPFIAEAVKLNQQSDVSFYNYGLIAKHLNKSKLAYQQFTNALILNPGVQETWNNRGTVCNDLEQYDEAISDFNKAIDLRPDYAEAYTNKGKSLSQLKRYDEAFAAYDKALSIKPDLAEAWLGRGNVFYNLKRYNESLAAHGKALSINPASAESWLGRGNVFTDLKRHDEAFAAYDKALSIRPDLAEAWLGRGNVFTDLKRHDEAFAAYDKALSIKPDLAEAWLGRGNVLTDLKRHAEAFAAYDRALSIKPDLENAWIGRGNVFHDLRRHDEALAAYGKALSIKPDLENAWLGRGNIFRDLKRHDEAFAAYDKALSLKSDLADAWLGRGNIFYDLKRYDDAFSAYDKALSFKPDLAEAWSGRGNIFCDLKCYDDAFAAYDKALSIKPNLEGPWLGRGNIFVEFKRNDEAFAAYDKALSLRPDLAEAWLGRGNIFCDLKRHDEAIAAYDKALSINPDLENAWRCRGYVHFEKTLIEEAQSDFRQALNLKKGFFVARVDYCLSDLQIIYKHETEIISRRSSYQKTLRALSDDVKTGAASGDCKDLFKSRLPFYLAYQGCNDRSLQQIYGSMACHIMGQEFAGAPLTQLAKSDEAIKIGFVSSFFYNHSNWKIPIKGWLSQLDRKRFKVFGYHLGKDRDSETDKAAKICDRFVQNIMTIDGWRKEILTDAPHVLIYPGLFMDAMSLQLAAQRLAPVQCNSWGHPDTSGMETLDYFLSSDLMEPPDATEHYTEELIRLPNLSIYYEPIDTESLATSRMALGLRQDAVVFWCGQSLYKYLPQYDEVFSRISESVENCQFVFIRHSGAEEVTDIFQSRLERAFASKNRKASDYCVILPKLNQSQFVSAMGCCDIFLDSIGWSGCNSTLESLPHNLPIITMEAPLMRGRHSAAILHMMDVKETITTNIDEYVSVAVRLANRPEERKSISEKIASNKQRIYHDRACVEALETFLERVGRE